MLQNKEKNIFLGHKRKKNELNIFIIFGWITFARTWIGQNELNVTFHQSIGQTNLVGDFLFYLRDLLQRNGFEFTSCQSCSDFM